MRRREIRPFVSKIAESIYKCPQEWTMENAHTSIKHRRSGLLIWARSKGSLGIWFGNSIDTDILNSVEKCLIWRVIKAHKINFVEQAVNEIHTPEN